MLSIVIKTLNEEGKVARAIESALAAGAEWTRQFGEPIQVVVADSRSSDATVAVASRYAVDVVQLPPEVERGCGAGVQLGYQASRGDYLYLLDGDMELNADFPVAARRRLDAEPTLAGVAGTLADNRVRNGVDRLRVSSGEGARIGRLPWLNGGGLYRRRAIAAAGGYAADPNLKAYEEAELGMRLAAAGWSLERLPLPAVRHTGHDLDTLALLARHWRSGRAMAAGVLLRSAWGQPWWWAAVRLLIHPLAILLWWLGGLAGALLLVLLCSARGEAAQLPLALALWSALLLAVLAGAALALAWRRRSLSHVALSLYHWHYGALAIVLGALRPQRSPASPLPVRVLHQPPTHQAPRAA